MLAAVGLSSAAVEYPGGNPGAANVSQSGATYTVSNEVLSADFTWKDGEVRFAGFKSADGSYLVKGDGPLFRMTLGNGRKLTSDDMEVSIPKLNSLMPVRNPCAPLNR